MRKFVPLFIASFFLSIHVGTLLYVNSSFLTTFFSPWIVSVLFLIGATLAIVLFLFTPRLIEKLGKHFLLISYLFLTLVTTLLLALSPSGLIVAVSFVIYSSTIPLVHYILDIFVEEFSSDGKTGLIRGFYLTILSTGILLGPLLFTFLSLGNSLKPLYVLGFLLIVIPLLLAVFSIRSPKATSHNLHHRALLPFGAWWRAKSVRRATLARLVLELFYGFMIIYTPLYLHSTLGFEWSVIGIMFTIMLLPFVIFQLPVGELADKILGEKELMIVGFIVMIGSLVSMPYLGLVVTSWTLALFFSRVGASLVQVTTDSYFFKHIGSQDAGFISIFRLAQPTGFMLGTLVGVLFSNLFSFEKLFFVMAVVVFFGLKEALLLRDTR